MKSMKYRKKPVVIEAIQFVDDEQRLCEIQEFVGSLIHVNYADKNNPVLIIDTPERTMTATVGDYVIKGVYGEFFPVKQDIFEETYEPV